MAMQESSSSPWNHSINSYNDESSIEDETDWEEVDVPFLPNPGVENDATTSLAQAGPSHSIEITLDKAKKKPEASQKPAVSRADRLLRLEIHKIHTICLISNGWIRNKYLNDRLLHARLMSLTPLALQMSFNQIHKKREPDAKRRGRLFEAAIIRLTQWWNESYFDAEPRGSGEVQSRTFDEVAAETLRKKETTPDFEHEEGEVIRSCKSLQKHALLRYGSRDVSAQLFTALCRALGIPARLVISIQSVSWKTSIDKPRLSYRSKKGKEKVDDVVQEQDDMEEVEIPHLSHTGKGNVSFPGDGQTLNPNLFSMAKGEGKTKPVVKLRKQRPQGRRLGSEKKAPGPPLGGYPPAQWTEVFSRADSRWLSIDSVRGFVDKRKLFEPPSHDKRNRMVYVLAFEEDGWVRDVTQRYAREFTNKTSKIRVSRKDKEWWDKVMETLTRPYRLHRDDVEDEELQSWQAIEGMPTSVAAFKDHPVYVLERHLLRDEVLQPRVEIGRFRGEPVYGRANVISGLKTAENWMRTGRVVAEGEQPMKLVKVRAVTIGRKRALGIAGEDNRAIGAEGESAMQGLYAKSQTELYRPPPVINGKVPKNDFGNIDLYVDTMLPTGGVHVPYNGVAKIAKELGFDYAEAVTGFEFKNKRAFPIVTGIVVAMENESSLLEAYWASAQDAEEKERIKREERVLKRWTRLVQGLRIRKRLQEQYADQPPGTEPQHGVDNREDIPEPEEGGFLLETADHVVQPYTLPKPLHVVDPLSGQDVEIPHGLDAHRSDTDDVNRLRLEEVNDTNVEEYMEEVAIPVPKVKLSVGRPRTMQQLAELAEADALEFAPSSSKRAPEVSQMATSAPLRTNGDAQGSVPARIKPTGGQKRARSLSSSDNPNDDERPKRGKTRAQVPVTSTRNLRPRIPKSDEKKRQERELELAYQHAIEE